MNSIDKSGIIIKKLNKFHLEEGDVLHAMKFTENEFKGFKEAYFSTIKQNKLKAWKRHLRMTMNLLVPTGEVQFNFFNSEGKFIINPIIGDRNYSRITVPPMIWFGFKGLSSKTSFILNISNELHDPMEVERRPLSFFNFFEEI